MKNEENFKYIHYKKVEVFNNSINVYDGNLLIRKEQVSKLITIEFENDQLFIKFIPASEGISFQKLVEKKEQNIDVFIDKSENPS